MTSRKTLFENTVGKGEHAGNHHFFFYSFSENVFYPSTEKFTILATLDLLSANVSNFDKSNILYFGKRLMQYKYFTAGLQRTGCKWVSNLVAHTAPFTISARALYNTLSSEMFSLVRAFTYVAWCLASIAFSVHIKCPQNSWHAHYSDAITYDPNYRTLFRHYHIRSKLSQCDIRTLVWTSCNVLSTCKSDVRFLKVVRWIAAIYTCVLWPWDCCSTCLM